MEAQPLVSIVLCTYNGEAYLVEQLESLEKQSYNNLEIICSDNNSTDQTKNILHEWCNKSGNRKFISIEEKGLNKNFFSAVKYANGDYIIFCDQDDIWLPQKIEKLVKFHQLNKDASLVYCLSSPFTDRISPIKSAKKNINRLEGSEIKQTLLISFTLGHNILISRKTLEQIQPPASETVAYDWWITVSAMCLGPVRCLHEELTYWRQHKDNKTKELNKDLFFKSRTEYLAAFATNNLISADNKVWINKAKQEFLTLSHKRFSFTLFRFLLASAPNIFFYKRKNNFISKWISYSKWALRMSRHDYRP